MLSCGWIHSGNIVCNLNIIKKNQQKCGRCRELNLTLILQQLIDLLQDFFAHLFHIISYHYQKTKTKSKQTKNVLFEFKRKYASGKSPIA